MTRISRNDVARLATMSSLQLADDEMDNLVQSVTDILAYVEQLNELDTDGVAPTYQVTGLENRWRQDDVEQGLTRDELLQLAPNTHDNQIKVPKVL